MFQCLGRVSDVTFVSRDVVGEKIVDFTDFNEENGRREMIFFAWRLNLV